MIQNVKEFVQNSLHNGTLKALRFCCATVIENYESGMLIDKDSLGENALRMLEIGIVQDKLVKLKCKLINHSDDANENLFNISRMQVYKFYEVIFWHDFAYFRGKKYFYNSETDIKELLQTVKELINHD